ncbi:uncharacterized protein APUU_40369A [Aspergillus puulaauensis]|uniref:Major facilitator superfamily (MFS) profile domain-containing protein n=1 Tax=Aspergillus puulaauensis TaxID=1220207 RepID=A0A7R7XM33_9EURO|nr:uncharacterized protein APUU_40369A [Aspergillus puulaauensis]BCS23925.1 hypothetical protein APUU_40369A [Aspergillus puulaauensis]
MLNIEHGHIGPNVGYFYFGITVVILIFTIFFVPETAQLPLEQINDFFLSGGKAWKTSTKRNRAIARANEFDSSKYDTEQEGEKDGTVRPQQTEIEVVARWCSAEHLSTTDLA